jgi:hypothetical protein
MDRLEMIDRLREEAGISYDEARSILESCGWNLSDALLMSEKHDCASQRTDAFAAGKKHLSKFFSRMLDGISRLFRRYSAASLQVSRNGKVYLELPFIAAVLLLIFMFWWIIAAVLLSMVFGCRYTVTGLSVDDSVNRAMDQAENFVSHVARDVSAKARKGAGNEDTDSEHQN